MFYKETSRQALLTQCLSPLLWHESLDLCRESYQQQHKQQLLVTALHVVGLICLSKKKAKRHLSTWTPLKIEGHRREKIIDCPKIKNVYIIYYKPRTYLKAGGGIGKLETFQKVYILWIPFMKKKVSQLMYFYILGVKIIQIQKNDSQQSV